MWLEIADFNIRGTFVPKWRNISFSKRKTLSSNSGNNKMIIMLFFTRFAELKSLIEVQGTGNILTVNRV